MNLYEQVLNITQVQELINIGFDVRKYATSAVIEAKDGNYYIVDRRLLSINMGFMETEVIEYFETLSIGDIMEILPAFIDIPFPAEMKIYPIRYFIDVNKAGVWYYNNDSKSSLISFLKTNIINSLFEILKWCIKNKHIKCQ